ncbi:hypothetical protein GSI_00166 [Ganoderma sinense ZZ0214-1]|uniref:Uncharacterized protein n=1 Tax=Ganoderma sinense ZZ0214-1 TaxID=1077348 RepID=A0A2G8SRT2_9APHY|nr:hypothetical protein GSI_00166 [Ganoderma sinense ZZ0214-1]
MQTNLPPLLAPLHNDVIMGAPNTDPIAVLAAAAPDTVKLDDVDDPSFQSAPSAAKKAPPPVIPPVDVFNMLTDNSTHPSPDAAALVGAQDADWDLRRRQVCTMIAQSRIKRGHLALDMCRLQAMHKAATGAVELFPQERFDAYMGLVNRCIYDDDDKVTAEDVQYHLMGVLPQSVRDLITNSSPAGEEDEDEDDHDNEDGTQDA